MKILYFTDAHIKGATPSGRSDIYYVAVLKKLMEIGYVVQKDKVDFVVIGGDLFDIPNVSVRIYSLVAKIIRKWKAKVFVIPGNHDVFGQSIESLTHTSLGALSSSGVVTIVTKDTSPICLGKRSEPNNIVALHGQEYYSDIDTGVNEDYNIDSAKANAFNLLVVHGFAVTKAFHPDVAHTIINTITSDADLILTGHYHPDRFEEKTANGVTLLKPRGFGRVEASKHNIDHKPDYLILEIENNTLKHYEFREVQCAPDGKDVFDAQYIANANKKQHKATLSSFTQSVTDVDLKETLSTQDMIKQMASSVQGVTQDHTLKALKMLVDSEKGVADKELDGFVPQVSEINIIEVELENFQSHKHSVIKLDPTALNVFIGASHSGKTAAIRALNWIFYNEPKGTDMINQSETKCKASVTFDNGMKLTRFRSKSSSGGYIIEDLNKGTTVEFNKFANNIPVEIFNAHQMPKIMVGKEKVSLNFGMQLDGPFMLSMTGSERATMIGNITGADVIDEAVASASSQIAGLQKGIKSVESDIEDVTNKISTYDVLGELKKSIDKIQVIVDYTSLLQEKLYKMNELINELGSNKKEILLTQSRLALMPSLYNIGEIIDDTEQLNNLYAVVSNLELYLSSIDKDINTCEKTIQKCSSADSVKTIIDKLDMLESRHMFIENVEASCNQVEKDISSIDLDKFNHLDSIMSYITEAERLNNSYSSIYELEQLRNKVENGLSDIKIPVLYDGMSKLDALFARYQVICEQELKFGEILSSISKESKFIKNKEIDILDITNEYKEKLKVLGECPVCNSVLSEDKIDHIVL